METNEKKMYLKPNVVIEPLVERWYAWSHLISPATAAMNIQKRHLTIMDSYLIAPNLHAQAVLNPKMLGGPFMDLKGERIEEVTALKKKTIERQSNLLTLAKAISDLDQLLLTECKGFGLESAYRKVPEALKGYVELFYDRHENPGFRIFEALLYKSEYFNQESQSVAIWITNNDHRPFCLSTPRLDEPHILHLNIPFEHHGIDELSRMKRTPQTMAYIENTLGISSNQKALFRTFFTETVPSSYSKYTGDKVRMRYFGHACILIETKNVSILVDPLISYYGFHSDIEHFSDVDLPDQIDYVLITHNHQDHILFETLLPLRHKIRHIIVPRTSSGKLEDPDLKLMFNSIGFNNVKDIGEMNKLEFEDTIITSLPFTGEHCDLNILTKCCYLVQIDEFKMMFLADSRIVEPAIYQHIHKQIGDIDVIFMGMECDGAPLSWLYGPLITKKIGRDQDASRRLSGSDCAKGMPIIDIFNPKELYVYAMGQEPWVEFISSTRYTEESNPIVQSNQLIKLCQAKGIIAERLFGEKELFYNRSKANIEVFST